MSPDAQNILDQARQLSVDDREWLTEQLLSQANEEAFAALEEECGEPEAGYEEWARTHIEEALADDSPGVPHEQVMREVDQMIRRAKEDNLKETA